MYESRWDFTCKQSCFVALMEWGALWLLTGMNPEVLVEMKSVFFSFEDMERMRNPEVLVEMKPFVPYPLRTRKRYRKPVRNLGNGLGSSGKIFWVNLQRNFEKNGTVCNLGWEPGTQAVLPKLTSFVDMIGPSEDRGALERFLLRKQNKS